MEQVFDCCCCSDDAAPSTLQVDKDLFIMDMC